MKFCPQCGVQFTSQSTHKSDCKYAIPYQTRCKGKFLIVPGIEVGKKGLVISGVSPEKVQSVWRVFFEESVLTHGPIHGTNASMEDKMHDWRFAPDGTFSFSGAAEKGTEITLLFEFKE